MPTLPREGNFQALVRASGERQLLGSRCGFPLFIVAVRIFGMLEIPQRAAACDGGDGGEVIVGWR